MSELVPSAQSPTAMSPAPAMAIPIAPITVRETVSPRKAREKPSVKSGVVFTSRTEAATDVKDRLAIQVAKWTPRATPDATSSARVRPDRAGHERRADAAANGARSSEARPMR